MTDWKETLFVWKGILTIVNNNNVEWKGTWVSTNDEKNNFPTDDDFASSKNNFVLYSSTITKHNNDSIDINFDRGHYLLDNGNGLEKFSDSDHNLYCIKHTDDRWYCFAKGDTEFGPFISKGIAINNNVNCNDNSDSDNDNDVNSTSYILTLARRYVYSKKDSRLNLPIETSTRQMMEELSSSSSTSSSSSSSSTSSTTTTTTTTNNEPKPWLDLPMKDKKKPSKKRDRDH